MSRRGRSCWLAPIALVAALIGSCAAEDPDGEPAADLLVRIDVGLEGVREVEVASVMPQGPLDRRPGARGRLAAHWVDADSGAVLARGRFVVEHVLHDEEFTDVGRLRATERAVDVVRRFVRVPRPQSGRGRLTLTWAGGPPQAFLFEVPLRGELPIAGTEVEVVDDVARPLTRSDGDGVGRSSSALTAFAAEHCGNGEHEPNLYYIGGYVGYIGEQCDDGNTDDGDGCSADCRYELTYVGGAPADSSSITVVFVPNRWGDLEGFLSYARFATEGTLAADWYDENTDKFSFWALDAEDIDALGSGACDRNILSGDVIDAVYGGRYDGQVRAHRPVQLVVTSPSNCRSNAMYGDSVLLGVDARPNVLAHELGHSIGILADEYPYPSCNPAGINVATTDPVPWVCLAEANGGPRCPDGEPVQGHSFQDACSATAPCRLCMMSTARNDFCPVCRRQMEAAVTGLLGSNLSETCNGADDDLNGIVDDDCDCSCTPSCDGRDCGGDGCFGSCGGCGALEACEGNACVPGCVDGCQTALGQLLCDGESGPFYCDADRGLASCTCGIGPTGAALVSCEACIPIDCVGCGAGQSCAAGSCVDACPGGSASCDGTCVDTTSDVRHCGACGNACDPLFGCEAGVCVPVDCAAGLVCDGRCVDPQTDAEHCGDCGRSCDSWQECRDGSCTACPSAASGLTDCGGYCADLTSDTNHCGACGAACPPNSGCNGVACSCAEGYSACGGECVDVNWNRRHCGACDVACAPSEYCAGSSGCQPCDGTLCVLSWESDWGTCTDLQTDHYNCGGCELTCADAQVCVSGRCQAP